MSNLMLLAEIGTADAGFCADSANIWQVVGYVLLIFKIVIPILLIILGMIDLGKAVVASKDDEIKKSIKSLMWRAIAAVVIFFVPTLISLIMGLVSNFGDSGAKSDFEICRTCISNPRDGSKCDEYANKLNDYLEANEVETEE